MKGKGVEKRKLTAMLLVSVAAAAAFAADVAWPSDFDEKLAAHITAEKSTNTTSVAYSMAVDTCYRTVASYGLAVSRTPGSGLYMIIR